MNTSSVLVAGLPRSDTTWIAEVLRRASGLPYVHEPDHEKIWPMAWVAKRELHRFPYLAAHDKAPEFEAMWRASFRGLHAREPIARVIHSFYGQGRYFEPTCVLSTHGAKRRNKPVSGDRDAMEGRFHDWRVRQFLLANVALEDTRS